MLASWEHQEHQIPQSCKGGGGGGGVKLKPTSSNITHVLLTILVFIKSETSNQLLQNIKLHIPNDCIDWFACSFDDHSRGKIESPNSRLPKVNQKTETAP